MCINRNCSLNYHNTIFQSFGVKKEYHLSSNFCDDLTFMITFTLQNIQYEEVTFDIDAI